MLSPRPHARRRLGNLLPGWLVCAVLALASCTTRPAPHAGQQNIVWPEPPEDARIAYVHSIRHPADIGIRPTGITRWVKRLLGAGASEQLIKPFAIALDESGNLCFTDTGANTVVYLDRTRKRWQRWERAGKTWFVSPVAIAKRGGLFYVADSGLGRIVVFDERGHWRFEIAAPLQRPAGLCITGDRLLVADTQRHCLVVFDLAGKHLGDLGKRGTGPGEFNFPTHISTDAAGQLYVTDSMNHRVQILDAAGQFQASIGAAGTAPGSFSRPKGVAVDTLGHVYVVDANFDNFQIFDRQGKLLLGVGQAGAEAGQFWLPTGIAVSGQNEIFVADSYNRRVQVFRYVGPQ